MWDLRFHKPEDIRKHLRGAFTQLLTVPPALFLHWAESQLNVELEKHWPTLKMSTLRLWLEGKLTDGKAPYTPLPQHGKKIELICQFLDVLETFRYGDELEALTKENKKLRMEVSKLRVRSNGKKEKKGKSKDTKSTNVRDTSGVV